jgi:hypothetical protein
VHHFDAEGEVITSILEKMQVNLEVQVDPLYLLEITANARLSSF